MKYMSYNMGSMCWLRPDTYMPLSHGAVAVITSLAWLLCWGGFVQHGGAAATLPEEQEAVVCCGAPRSVPLSCSDGYVIKVKEVTEAKKRLCGNYATCCTDVMSCAEPADDLFVRDIVEQCDGMRTCWVLAPLDCRASFDWGCTSLGAHFISIKYVCVPVDISTTTLPTEITDKERTTIDSVEPLTRGRVTPSDSHTAMTTLPNETTIGRAKTRGSVTHPESYPGVWLGIGAGVLCVVASVVLLTVYFIRRTSGAVNNSKKPPDAQQPCSTQIPVDIPPTNPTNDYVHQGPEAEYDCAAEYTIDPTIPNIQEEPFKLRQNPLILAATSRGQIASHTAPVTGEPDTDMDEYELHMLENGIYGDAATTGGEIMALKNVSS